MDMKSYERSWNLNIHYIQAWKSHGLQEKWLRSWKSHGISFLIQILCAVWKLETHPSSSSKIIMITKKAGFSVFLCHGLKLIMEKSLNFIAQFLCEPVFE